MRDLLIIITTLALALTSCASEEERMIERHLGAEVKILSKEAVYLPHDKLTSLRFEVETQKNRLDLYILEARSVSEKRHIINKSDSLLNIWKKEYEELKEQIANKRVVKRVEDASNTFIRYYVKCSGRDVEVLRNMATKKIVDAWTISMTSIDCLTALHLLESDISYHRAKLPWR